MHKEVKELNLLEFFFITSSLKCGKYSSKKKCEIE